MQTLFLSLSTGTTAVVHVPVGRECKSRRNLLQMGGAALRLTIETTIERGKKGGGRYSACARRLQGAGARTPAPGVQRQRIVVNALRKQLDQNPASGPSRTAPTPEGPPRRRPARTVGDSPVRHELPPLGKETRHSFTTPIVACQAHRAIREA